MENIDEKESALKWLLPLIILIVFVVVGAWFCTTKPPEPKAETPPANTTANSATNANR